ncbi:MAG: leader peptide processing enzyme [Treponema sp.]|jgi:hypothetical protein|nr:leader peptide processing enzyme [Treponema sp.]
MSKKTNTLLFILGATFFNIIVTVVCFTALLVLYARFLAPLLPETGRSWGFPVIFIAAIALSFVIYRVALKQLMKKIDVEKHFDPIFGGRRGPRKD